MIVIVKLILAHILGDFFLQPDGWVQAKEEKKGVAWQLYVHSLLHGMLSLLLLFDLNSWWLVACITVSHLSIDYLKLKFQTENSKIIWFSIDQILHLMVILVLGCYWQNIEKVLFDFLVSDSFIIQATALIFLTKPASIVLNILIQPWSIALLDEKEKSLKSAGKYIGIIERIVIFVFICTNHFEAVGFLLATKSVFRFGDLKESKERKLTEYLLIGTLLSFGIALFTGLMTQYLVTLV